MKPEKLFIMYMKGLVVPRGKVTSGDEEWKTFEQMMCKGLELLGFQFNKETIYFGDHVQEMNDADFVIYAHKTRRDLFANLYHKQMHMRYLFTLDHMGWGADHSEVQEKPDFERMDIKESTNFCIQRRQQFLSSGDSKFAQPKINVQKEFPDDFLFFPLQRPDDDTIKYNAHLEVEEAVIRLSKWATARKQNLVFKLHPGNLNNDIEVVRCVEECASMFDYVHVLEGNIHDFIHRSKGVIVINSGVGFESLIHGKPVVTLGNCDYKWVTFNASVNTLDQARNYIFKYTNEQRIRAWQFIYYYFFHHAYCIEAEYREAAFERLCEYLRKAVLQTTVGSLQSEPSET